MQLKECFSTRQVHHLPSAELMVLRLAVRDACVNDLEAPAFAVMPELAQLKERLAGEGLYDAVFMTGAAQHVLQHTSAAASLLLRWCVLQLLARET